ncbi:MAG: HAD-IA family hydrolase [Theionarchaea archaeon]|nr:HAD-IA family hydrolase [Theionarchaea archaeon]MBU7001013.1 HAD-IA family hydrolase [Theionarchaea archaeon]MBU7020502.1 HAD-IA family hydrolase [Theionarchaea archaeon]MBU7034455.1 HAD-IA family hydrolase [Theionarchaea archaeon]MBU7039796.1 HAD-IA family hydrolase [Theionarchaea archaeon]
MTEELAPTEILELELPPGISILIVGPPGSGKTILAQQLVHRALERGKSAIIMASKSQVNALRSQEKLFGWDVSQYLSDGRLGLMEIENVGDPSELNIGLAQIIQEVTPSLALVVVDSLTVLMVAMEERNIMKFTEGLARKLQDHSVSSLLLATPTKETEDFLTKMKSLVSSVIEIRLTEIGTIHRYMRIFKFLDRKHSTLWYPFEITSGGIMFAASAVKTPDTFLFDLDGTLVTMELDFVKIRKEVDRILVRWGYPPELLEETRSTLETIREAVSYLDSHSQDGEGLKKEAETYLEQVEMEAASRAQLIEGAKTVLQILKKKKKKIGIITRNHRAVALKVLKRCGLEQFVDLLLARDDVERVKPHPDHMLEAVRRLGSEPEKTVVLGDHHYEIEAGNEAGCFTIGVLTGSGTRKTLKDADLILNSVEDLKEVFRTVGR